MSRRIAGALPVIFLSALFSCKSQPPRGKDAAQSVEESWRLAPEFAPVREVLMAWDPEFEDYYEELVTTIGSEADISLVVPPAEYQAARRFARRLASHTMVSHQIQVATFPIESMWMRDFGPLVVRRGQSEEVIDMDYQPRDVDDALAKELADNWLQLPTQHYPLLFEGGNLQTDGEGHCFVTSHILVDNPQYTELEIRSYLRRAFGCRVTEIISPLWDEPTGHVDMFLTVTGPREIIVGRYSAKTRVESQAREQLDATAKELAEHGYLVRRVPMPPPQGETHRSYTNSLAVNEIVLVPSYAKQDQEEFLQALAVFEEAYPGREIIPIDSSEIIEFKGAIHCTVMTIAQ